MNRVRSRFFLAFAFAAAVLGCGKGQRPKMNVYPVSGKLTVAGKPGKGLIVTLFPTKPLADPRYKPAAVVGADGSFKLQTYEAGDGAPAGEYSVFVSARELSPNSESLGDDVRQVLKKYESTGKGRQATGPKSVAEIAVKEGDNALESIDLK